MFSISFEGPSKRLMRRKWEFSLDRKTSRSLPRDAGLTLFPLFGKFQGTTSGRACGRTPAARVGLLHRFMVGVFAIEVRFIQLSHPPAFDSKVATLPFRTN